MKWFVFLLPSSVSNKLTPLITIASDQDMVCRHLEQLGAKLLGAGQAIQAVVIAQIHAVHVVASLEDTVQGIGEIELARGGLSTGEVEGGVTWFQGFLPGCQRLLLGHQL